MKQRLRTTSAAGRLNLWLRDPRAVDEARQLVEGLGANRARQAGPIRFMGRDAWLKASALCGRARLRHGLLHCTLGTPPARVREAANLAWLEARLFRVPAPLAAGWLGGAFPSWQFLISEFVASTPLDVALRASPPDERAVLLLELARETARMHALHFVHRDLYWRNLLVSEPSGGRRLLFIDAWRGGERLQLRGPAYDLACLFLEGPSLLRAEELRAWLQNYTLERAALGSPVRPAQLWPAASAARRSLLERVRGEPGRWRVPEPPVQVFDFAAALR